MVGWTGEADNEVDATLLGDNVLYCSPDCGLGVGAVGSSVAAGTDEEGTMNVSDADLACGRKKEGLPAGGRRGGE